MLFFKRWVSCVSLALALVSLSAEKARSADSECQARESCSVGSSYIQQLTQLQKGFVGHQGLGELEGDANCDSFDKWPSVDNSVTCGGCKALVLTEEYGGRCDKYCESFGHVCAAAAEEAAENCDELYTKPCNEEIPDTSDMLCTCHRPPAPTPVPAVAPSPSPDAEECCKPFDVWPNVDNGVTCGACTALVLTEPYGGRCDEYCASFGQECVAASEEDDEGCHVMYSGRCDVEIVDTSDMLCTCRSLAASASCTLAREPAPAPESAPVPDTEAPTPRPQEEECCKPFDMWPSVDNGVTCEAAGEACKALVLTEPYGGRCDRYCESFGHVCIAAAEEVEESCSVQYSQPCDVEVAATSDMLCTCHLPAAGVSCTAPAPEPTPSPQPPGAGNRIEIRGRQLLVGGTPLHLKGVAWNPTPKGSSRLDFQRFVEQDADLMAQAGINAVRTYSHIGDRSVLDALWARGIWVVNSVFNTGDTNQVASRVNEVKDHPAILMWTIGNEWNYNGLYSQMSHGSAMARVAEVARIVKANDPEHPVASIYGSVPSQDVISALGDIDIWGLNVYKGIGFGDTFDKFAARSGKPMFFGEYGADAFDARQGREDQASQAEATKVLSEAITARSSVRTGGVCLGGFVFEFADEWWKDQSGSKSRQDVGGIAPGGGPYPDATFNEEWWGLVDIDRRPRAAFHAYAAVPNPTEA